MDRSRWSLQTAESNRVLELWRLRKVSSIGARLLSLIAVALWLAGHVGVARADYAWNLPPNFPEPKVPEDNPMSREKVELGRFVFYDTRMSGNETQSCGSCHQQRLAFTDGRPVGVGSTGQLHPRNSMTLTNAAYPASYAWANPVLTTLEKQVLLPMFGETPVELGLAGMEDVLIARFKADSRYQRMFAEAFPNAADPITLNSIVQSLTCFVRTLISGNAPYDRYVNGLDDNALSPSAQNGGRLLFTERFECFHCHGAVNTWYPFSDSVTFAGYQFDDTPFHNNGLYNIDGMGGYPPNNTGLFAMTNVPSDMGAFKAPTLRNIELTAPYMHDGSIATLDGVIDHYAAGGRTITDGPYAGDGSKNPFKSGFIRGFQLTDQERQDILNFLKSLTDTDFITNPHFSDPFMTTACGGDCNLDGSVTIDELIAAVNIALGSAPLASCVAADVDGDGAVTINELIAAVNHALNGCPSPTSTPTVTATPTGTQEPTATATPLPSVAGQEDLFGSAVQGSGALTINALPQVPVYFSTCLGGTGASCDGGSIVYIGSDPGFKEADTDDPSFPLFALPAGVTVGLEVIAIDPALSLMFEAGDTLTTAGQSIELGTTPGIHADLEWQLLLPADAPFDAGHPVTLKLTTTTNGYTDSTQFTVTIRPSTGSAPNEPD